MAPFDRLQFILAFHSSYGAILYHFRDKAIYWSKSRFFIYNLHLTPVRGSPSNVAIGFDVKKLEWCDY